MLEPEPGLSYEEQEEQRRVFWSIYILDKLCCCGRARPASIGDDQCRLQLPTDEKCFREGRYEKTQTLAQGLSADTDRGALPGDFASIVLMASIVGRCSQLIIHQSDSDDKSLPPWDSKSDFAAIYSTLLRLESQLNVNTSIHSTLNGDFFRDGIIDMQLVGPLVYSRALFYVSQCMLHHPFLLANQARVRGFKMPNSFNSFSADL